VSNRPKKNGVSIADLERAEQKQRQIQAEKHFKEAVEAWDGISRDNAEMIFRTGVAAIAAAADDETQKRLVEWTTHACIHNEVVSKTLKMVMPPPMLAAVLTAMAKTFTAALKEKAPILHGRLNDHANEIKRAALADEETEEQAQEAQAGQ